MKLYRFVGKNELKALRKDKKVYNHTIFRDKGHKTDSVGFCFFEFEDEYDVEYAYEYMSGIVSEYAVVVVDINKNRLKEGYGTYADPYGSWHETFLKEEYSTIEYEANEVVGVYYPNFDADGFKLGEMYDLFDLSPVELIEKKEAKRKKEHQEYLKQQEIDHQNYMNSLELLELDFTKISYRVESDLHEIGFGERIVGISKLFITTSNDELLRKLFRLYNEQKEFRIELFGRTKIVKVYNVIQDAINDFEIELMGL